MRRLLALLLFTFVGCFDDSDVANVCRSDENCPVGQVCRESPIEPGRLICMQSCVRDDECAAGEACSFGRCQPGLPGAGDGAAEAGAGADMAGADMAGSDMAGADMAGDGALDASGDGAVDLAFPPPDALLDGGEPDLGADLGVEADLGALDLGPLDLGAPSVDLDVDDDRGI